MVNIPSIKGYNSIFFCYIIFLSICLPYSNLDYILSWYVSFIYYMIKWSRMTQPHALILRFHISMGVKMNYNWFFWGQCLHLIIRHGVLPSYHYWQFFGFI